MFGIFNKLFGYRHPQKDEKIIPSPVTGENVDATNIVVDTSPTFAGGLESYRFTESIDFNAQTKSEEQLIKTYRTVAQNPECDLAISDIIAESIITEPEKKTINLVLDAVEQSDSIKKKILEEFEHVYNLLQFNKTGYELFKKWYIDGRLYVYKVVDPKNEKNGIQALKQIDPLSIKQIKIRSKQVLDGVDTIVSEREYYAYDINLTKDYADKSVIKLSKDSVAFINSGIINSNKTQILSYLHKAIKPTNQLRMIEDAVVIYRLARAPERRIFFIDVGELPAGKAEQYVQNIMVKHKNKMVYDTTTGEIKDDRKFASMLEDYWLPRREGGRGTEVTTLPGGTSLGEVSDVEYFEKKLYTALNVPMSRLQPDNAFNIGRSAEISRDEVKFKKFIERLQTRFSGLFNDILYTQLISKKIISEEDWKSIKENIRYIWNSDSFFNELKESEVLKERIENAIAIEDFVGKYYSREYVRKVILKQTEEQIKEIDAQIEAEKPLEDEYREDDLDAPTIEPEEEPEPKPEPKEKPEENPEEKKKPIIKKESVEEVETTNTLNEISNALI